MHRRYGLLIALSAIVVAATVYAEWTSFLPYPQLPFTVRWVDADHALIEPIAGVTPTSLRAGDRLDLAAQSRATRIALVASELVFLPESVRYPLVLERGAGHVRVTVHAVNGNSGGLANWGDWTRFCSVALWAAIALLALWRGRDRAAWGMSFWAMGAPFVVASSGVSPSDNRTALIALVCLIGFSQATQIGLYVMAESIAGSSIRPGTRARWRGLFALIFSAATIVTFGGPIGVVVAGWAGLMHPWLRLLIPSFNLVTIALLVTSFRRPDARQRERLRWLLWGNIALAGAVVFVLLPLNYSEVAFILDRGVLTLGALALLYAVLRHRVVEITVVINRALVYALTTSLVLGLFALLESLIERTTLGRSAGLLLELTVPLGLGIALSSVHRRVEELVDRFIFRRQYRADTALRRFGEDCSFIRERDRLFALSVEQIARHTEAPQVALYERSREGEGYVCRRQIGAPALPEMIPTDDLAFVALRARNAELALHDAPSLLGTEGYAYPLMLRGDLLGALVVGERPGEHYAADERALLFHVAREIGAALFALRAQELEARADESEARSRTSELLLQEARVREAALLNALGASGAAADAR